MKGNEIINNITSDIRSKMPDIEQVRENCLNQVADSISDPQQKTKKSKQVWKPIIKFALPALMILGVFCFQILGGTITKIMDNPWISGTSEVKNNNWFSLVAYASENTTFAITKDMKVKLPAGTWYINRNYDYNNPDPHNGDISHSWTMAYDESGNPIPGGFVIEGENIKSVKFESKNGCFVYAVICQDEYDEIAEQFSKQYAGPKNTVYLEKSDIKQSKNFIWGPFELVNSRFIGDYQKYLTDTITTTITFDDGEVMTQTVEITIDEYTGDMFAQITG